MIVITAFGSVETAVEAMKSGAADFVTKPFSLDHLLTVVRKALEVRALREENTRLREELGVRYEFDNIIGRSPAMQEIFATIIACGSDARDSAAGRRKRRGQGPDCARHSLSFAAA